MRLRKRAIRFFVGLFPGSAPFVMPMALRWGWARIAFLMRPRGLIRGTMLVWPYPGRAMPVGLDLAKPRAGEVLVRVDASAISPGTERAFFMRQPNAMARFPYFPGYSSAGEVIATGRGVRQPRAGDRVALVTEHASVAVVPAKAVCPVPDGVSQEDAASVHLGVIALQAFEKGRVRSGEPVAVIGQGFIGQLLAQFAAAHGARPVVSVARTDRRVSEPLRRATHRIIVLDRDGAASADGLEAAVTFEATGAPDAVSLAIRCTRPGGCIVLAGSTRGATLQTDFGLLADKVLTIVGAHVTGVPETAWRDYARTYLGLLEQKRVDVTPLITERVDPAEAEWFYRRLSRRDDATVGAVFAWSLVPDRERARPVSFFALPDLSPLRGGRMTTEPLAAHVPRGREGAALE
jgi:2-desacetyl-2-hydroxyethyl bacteriochlorophyllide A dehydrogenase